MSLSLHAGKALVCSCLVLGVPALVSAEGTYLTNGIEYSVAGAKPGDQVHPDLALNGNGGYLVWEDNASSSAGLTVNALRLDSGFSASLSSFKVNSSSVGDNERARVSVLNDGGAVFVWQGGTYGYQHVYARFLSASNVWNTGDILVNSSTNFSQLSPAVATLNNGNVVVVWSSFNQQGASSLYDVYGQMFSPDGQKIGSEFPVNQFTPYNQRTPAIAALSTGGFVTVWVSEQQRRVGATTGQLTAPSQMSHPSVDIYARLFSSSGQPVNNEFQVNIFSNVCANPTVAAGQGGAFSVGWGERDSVVPSNNWDVFARVFSANAVGGGVSRINTETYGGQLGPRLSAAGSDYLMVWTSMGQDSSAEGVFGQFLQADGSPNGGEFRVNTTWVSKQIHPVVASDGSGRFLVSWTSFTGGVSSFDLFAQRYVNGAQPLQSMAAPFVYVPFNISNGSYQPSLVISWPLQTGLPVDHYELVVDGNLTVSPASNSWTMTVANGLTASSTHTFQVAAVLTNGRRTPPSPVASGTTWDNESWGGIPWKWMAAIYGSDISQWPPANSSLGQGAPTLYQVFLTGGNPKDPSTWLQTSLEVAQVQGQAVYLLHWNTQPGLTYQVQTSSDAVNWADFQSPRLAADITDSVAVPKNDLQYYRLVRLR
jgi:hypothetical protein